MLPTEYVLYMAFCIQWPQLSVENIYLCIKGAKCVIIARERMLTSDAQRGARISLQWQQWHTRLLWPNHSQAISYILITIKQYFYL